MYFTYSVPWENSMLGRETQQVSFFDPSFVCAHLIDKKSFYAKMREHADSIISDDDFADIYCADNGRPSVPPARLAKVLILQHHDNVPDRQALNMVRFNILWKYALNVPLDYAGFDPSLLTVFRARLLCHKKEKLLFRQTLALAKEAGLLRGQIDQVIDSTPMLGRGAVKDTYELIRDGIRRTLRLVDPKIRASLKLSLSAYGTKSAKPKIDWDDTEQRQELLSSLVADARNVLSCLTLNETEDEISPECAQAARLLARILSQDIQEEKGKHPTIRNGVAKDRIISTTDPDMRHGRKSSSGKFNGYKAHITKEVTSDIVTSITVAPANRPDGEETERLLTEADQDTSLHTRSVCGDGAYSSGAIKEQLDQRKTVLISKVPASSNGKRISKEHFHLDRATHEVICPQGKKAKRCTRTKDGHIFIFSRETCQACPRRQECTTATRTGRTITVGPYEEYLRQARQYQKTNEFTTLYHKRRPPVERKISELVHHGLRQSRYRGMKKSRLQALCIAAVVNLKRIFKEQVSPDRIAPLPGVVPVPT